MKNLLLFPLLFLLTQCRTEDHIDKHSYIIASYNVENLFDTKNDPKTFDDDFTPNGRFRWDEERYQTKLKNLSTVISDVSNGKPADVLGLIEVENKSVIKELLAQDALSSINYGIVHRESIDPRGIDVALIYNTAGFSVKSVDALRINLSGQDEVTRDVLFVLLKEKSSEETFGVFVNHWPSRRGGKYETWHKRMDASYHLVRFYQEKRRAFPESHFIVLGDFNDEPNDKSLKHLESKLSDDGLANLFTALDKKRKGSYRFRDDWNMLDQILVSKSLNDSQGWEMTSKTAKIKDDSYLKQKGVKYAGYPLRTLAGQKYLGGYSDHFMVYAQLQKSN
jgi:predicted extracellular nuclease